MTNPKEDAQDNNQPSDEKEFDADALLDNQEVPQGGMGTRWCIGVKGLTEPHWHDASDFRSGKNLCNPCNRAYSAKYRKDNPEKERAYKQDNAERQKEYDRQRYAANREKEIARSKAYYKAHRAERDEYKRRRIIELRQRPWRGSDDELTGN